MQSLSTDIKGTELEINNRKISEKSLNIWKPSNTLLNNMSQKKSYKFF